TATPNVPPTAEEPSPTPTVDVTAGPATPAQILQITLITPTPFPTLAPSPTPALFPTDVLSNTLPGGNAGPTTVAGPSPLGSSAGDAALIAVLQKCWHLSDTRQLNGNNPDHRNAFDCARAALLQIVQNYPAYALVHRV